MPTSPIDNVQLSDQSLAAFDVDFRDWPPYEILLNTHVPTAQIHNIADVGGGNGLFLDKLLHRYPQAKGVLIDNAPFMLERNRQHPRKQVICCSATELHSHFTEPAFDLITVNVLLHHLIAAEENTTRWNVMQCLTDLRKILRPEAYLVVYEQVFDGFWPMFDPGTMVYRLTSIKQPMVTSLMHYLGANTAGIGVRFRSRAEWREIFGEVGFKIASELWAYRDPVPLYRRLALGIRDVGSYLFLLRPDQKG